MEQIEQSSRDVQSELPDRGDQGDFPGIDGVEAPDRDEEIDQRGSHSSSSDSEDDQDLSGGYMLLPQGIDEEETSSECPSASAEDNSPSLEIRNRTNYQEGKEEEEEEEEEVKGEEEGKGVEEEEGKGEGVEEEGATASSVANPQPVAVLENCKKTAVLHFLFDSKPFIVLQVYIIRMRAEILIIPPSHKINCIR